MIEEYIDPNFWKTKLILKGNRITSWTNMTKRVELKAIQVDQEIKALMRAKDLHFQEGLRFRRRAVFRRHDL